MIPAHSPLSRPLWLLSALLLGAFLFTGHDLALAQKKKKPDPKEVAKPPEPKKEIPKDKTPPLATIAAHKDWIHNIDLSADGKYLLTASRDKTVKIWDVAAGKEAHTLKGLPASFKDAAFSPDGKQVVAGAGGWDKKKKQWIGEIKVFDVVNGKEVRSLTGHGEAIEALAYSSDGKKLVSGSDDKTAIIWDLSTGKEVHTLKGHGDQVLSVAFNKDGSKVATGSRDKTVKVWEVGSGKDVLTLKGPEREITSVVFAPDGQIAAASLDETIRIWDAAGKDVKTLKTPEGIWSIAFSKDGKYLVAGGWNDTIKVFDVASGKEVAQRNGHKDTITGVAFLPDGRFVSAGIDGIVRVWAVEKK